MTTLVTRKYNPGDGFFMIYVKIRRTSAIVDEKQSEAVKIKPNLAMA